VNEHGIGDKNFFGTVGMQPSLAQWKAVESGKQWKTVEGSIEFKEFLGNPVSATRTTSGLPLKAVGRVIFSRPPHPRSHSFLTANLIPLLVAGEKKEAVRASTLPLKEACHTRRSAELSSLLLPSLGWR